MEKPNKNEILKRNPHLDRKVFEENEKKLAELRSAGVLKPRPQGGGAILPYGGRRLITDERIEVNDLNREGYGAHPI
jgi:hypothetical protein